MCVFPFLQSPICVADLCALLLRRVRAYALVLSNADSPSLQRGERAQIPLSEPPCLGYTRPRRVHLGLYLAPKVLSFTTTRKYLPPSRDRSPIASEVGRRIWTHRAGLSRVG
ncbi:hypothetical protein C8R44DRAFT_747347 [Mycena epipterygia]|nr:hypothetical protein C8R44DRAFT_747347 [Mycena epipterygia]